MDTSTWSFNKDGEKSVQVIDSNKKSIAGRLSFLRLAGYKGIKSTTIEQFVYKKETELNFQIAYGIIQAERCLSYIEGARDFDIEITSPVIIALLTIYPLDILHDTILSPQYKNEVDKIANMIKEMKKENIVDYIAAAVRALHLVSFKSIVKSNVKASLYLIVNLLLARHGKILILEDTDYIDENFLMDIGRTLRQC
jgi:hypothetical protein